MVIPLLANQDLTPMHLQALLFHTMKSTIAISLNSGLSSVLVFLLVRLFCDIYYLKLEQSILLSVFSYSVFIIQACLGRNFKRVQVILLLIIIYERF